MSLEGRIVARLEAFIGERLLKLIDAALLRHVERLEKRVEALERREQRDEQIIARLARLEHRDHREIERIERKLRPHHYPATKAVTVKPA